MTTLQIDLPLVLFVAASLVIIAWGFRPDRRVR